MIVVLMAISINSNAADLITLETRAGIEQKFILINPEAPKASVILFAGGHGTLGLTTFFGAPSIGMRGSNFLVRTRDLFAQNGFQVAVVDAPSDQQSDTGMRGGFRDSFEHVNDIDHVISYLRKKADVPVWLVGTSRGTESATNLAINSKQKPDGLVLTSSMSEENNGGVAVTEMYLDKITVPTLIVANSNDECRHTPPEGAEEISSMLSSAKKVEVKIFSGGDSTSKPCKAMSYHGYMGIEEEVVGYISKFIKSN